MVYWVAITIAAVGFALCVVARCVGVCFVGVCVCVCACVNVEYRYVCMLQ